MSKPLSVNQKTFNKAVKFLLKQNVRSMDKNNQICMYRGQNNTRCGAGCLIPNRVYSVSMEGDICNSLSLAGKALEKLGYKLSFVRAIQRIHDGYSPCDWKNKLEELAEEEGLVWPKGV